MFCLQVLSASVAHGLEHFQIEGSEETARFVRMFDKFFDCLNVRSLRSVKSDRRGYTTSDDERREVSHYLYL